jgi:4'-phosphopantetheinyl transferase EntD
MTYKKLQNSTKRSVKKAREKRKKEHKSAQCVAREDWAGQSG